MNPRASIWKEASRICATALCTMALSCGGDEEGAGGGASGGPAGSGATASVTGGAPGTGGGAVTGGAPASGGATTGGTGGGGATGGASGAGGSSATGGASGAGGNSAAGGASGAGGTAGAGSAGADGGPNLPPVGCRAPVPSANPGNTCYGAPPPALELTPITSGLSAPVFVTQAPGDPSRLFVVERAGRIRVILNGTLEQAPFLDITGRVRAGGEQGLLGLAFDPNYQQTGRFWVNYTGETGWGDTVVSSFQGAPGEPADPASETVLFTVQQSSAFGNHNGGMIAFGPDGCLFVGMGDGGGGNDPDGHGQDALEPLGNMLRVDVDNYPLPAPGNLTGPVDPHTWDYGLRNPWRFSFDRQTGDLYIGDVGQDAWEEIDVEPAGTGQRNYGWNVMEGLQCRGGGTGCDQTGLILPVVQRSTDTHQAIIGGYVYRGSNIPDMAGRYVYGDHSSRTLWSFVYQGQSGGVDQICDDYTLDITPGGDISSFGEDLAGELYVVTLNGTVYRIDPA